MLVRFIKNVRPTETAKGGIYVTGRTVLGVQVRIFGEGDRAAREEYLEELCETLAAGGVWHVDGVAVGTTVVKGDAGSTAEHFKAWGVEVTPATAEEIAEASAEVEAANKAADRAAFERRLAAGPQVVDLPALTAARGRDGAGRPAARTVLK